MTILVVYCDGACPNNQLHATRAAWAFVAVSETEHGTCEILQKLSGDVLLDRNLTGFIGAERLTNQTAELSAMYHSFEFCLRNISFISHHFTQVVFASDSEYVLKGVFGSNRAHQNISLVTNTKQALRRLISELSRIGVEVGSKKVKGHGNSYYHNMADELAQERCRANR